MPEFPAKSFLSRCARWVLGRQLPASPRISGEILQLGNPAYGSWVIRPTRVASGALIYSFGVGEDISWDLAMIERYGATVHAFDPTPRSCAWVKRQPLPERFVLHEYGIAAYDGVAKFYPPENPAWVSHTLLEDPGGAATGAIEVPVRRFKTIMAELGHEQVDLIKMDVEGAEYTIIGDLLGVEPAAGGASQILIEFHHRFPGKSAGDTRACIRALGKKGFRPFHASSTGEDWSFLRDG